jgi:hypothetical protein
MDKRIIAYKCFLLFVVLFCAYMQLSPVVDLDYVWIDGHEHYVGAANPHQPGISNVPILLETVQPHSEECVLHLLQLPVEQSPPLLAQSPTLRL